MKQGHELRSVQPLATCSGFSSRNCLFGGSAGLRCPFERVYQSPKSPKVLMYPFLALAGAFQIYFWGFWSALCIAIALDFTQKPEVTWDWLYWISAFSWCISLIGWFGHKEQQTSTSAAESRGIHRGTTLYSLVAIGAFVVFAFAPRLMLSPYGWALRLLGLAT
jgi:hypothetical protein